MPIIVHLEQLHHIFWFLKEKPKLRLAFDPAHYQLSGNIFQKYDWQDLYLDAEEATPRDIPILRGE